MIKTKLHIATASATWEVATKFHQWHAIEIRLVQKTQDSHDAYHGAIWGTTILSQCCITITSITITPCKQKRSGLWIYFTKVVVTNSYYSFYPGLLLFMTLQTCPLPPALQPLKSTSFALFIPRASSALTSQPGWFGSCLWDLESDETNSWWCLVTVDRRLIPAHNWRGGVQWEKLVGGFNTLEKY